MLRSDAFRFQSGVEMCLCYRWRDFPAQLQQAGLVERVHPIKHGVFAGPGARTEVSTPEAGCTTAPDHMPKGPKIPPRKGASIHGCLGERGYLSFRKSSVGQAGAFHDQTVPAIARCSFCEGGESDALIRGLAGGRIF